jgi:hypothetical protein
MEALSRVLKLESTSLATDMTELGNPPQGLRRDFLAELEHQRRPHEGASP